MINYEKYPNESQGECFHDWKIHHNIIIWFWNEIPSHDCDTKPRNKVELEGIIVEKNINCRETGNWLNGRIENMKNQAQNVYHISQAMVLKDYHELGMANFHCIVKYVGYHQIGHGTHNVRNE